MSQRRRPPGLLREPPPWAPEDFATWVDEEWNLLDDPILYPAYDETLPFSFRVK